MKSPQGVHCICELMRWFASHPFDLNTLELCDSQSIRTVWNTTGNTTNDFSLLSGPFQSRAIAVLKSIGQSLMETIER